MTDMNPEVPRSTDSASLANLKRMQELLSQLYAIVDELETLPVPQAVRERLIRPWGSGQYARTRVEHAIKAREEILTR